MKLLILSFIFFRFATDCLDNFETVFGMMLYMYGSLSLQRTHTENFTFFEVNKQSYIFRVIYLLDEYGLEIFLLGSQKHDN